jgi:hypothetical protein
VATKTNITTWSTPRAWESALRDYRRNGVRDTVLMNLVVHLSSLMP